MTDNDNSNESDIITYEFYLQPLFGVFIYIYNIICWFFFSGKNFSDFKQSSLLGGAIQVALPNSFDDIRLSVFFNCLMLSFLLNSN
jgi:hypothetical protein